MLPLILIDFVMGVTPNNVNLYNTATEPLIQKLHCQLRVGLVSLETDSMLLFCPLCLEIMTYSIRSLRVGSKKGSTRRKLYRGNLSSRSPIKLLKDPVTTAACWC